MNSARLRLLVLAAAGLLATVAGIALSPARADGRHALSAGERRGLDPAQVTARYYESLAAADYARAFDLLCSRQQALGRASYRSHAAASITVRAWRASTGRAQGTLAEVDGKLDLADGSSTLLAVLLVRESHGWGVCTSNLGGVLPGPGTTTGPTTI